MGDLSLTRKAGKEKITKYVSLCKLIKNGKDYKRKYDRAPAYLANIDSILRACSHLCCDVNMIRVQMFEK
jgi:hypothetical protein